LSRKLIFNLTCIAIFNSSAVCLKDFLRQHEFVLINLKVKISNKTENLEGVRIDFLVEASKNLLGRLKELGKFGIKEEKDVEVSDLLELKGVLHVWLEKSVHLRV
jgi:hypothetical protein